MSTAEQLGGARTHATRSGVAAFVAPDERSCLENVRYLLSFLPQNNLEEPLRGSASATTRSIAGQLDEAALARARPSRTSPTT